MLTTVSFSTASYSKRITNKGGKPNMTLNQVPRKSLPQKKKGSVGRCRLEYSAIKNYQHEAWMFAINRGFKYGSMTATSVEKLTICDKNFHPSLFIKGKDRTYLKCIA